MRHGRNWLASKERGMTIIELLAAVLIGLLVVSAAMDAYLTMHTQSIAQDQVTEMQQSGRAVMRVLSNRLRMAGFSLPSTVASLSGANSNPDTITIRNEDADACEVSSTQAMAATGDAIVCTGANLSCFTSGMRAYVYDASATVGEYFTVSGVYASPDRIAHPALTRTYPSGARVSFIRETSFYIDRSDTLHPIFVQKEFGAAAQPFADDIENLNFSYLMTSGDTVLTPTTPTLVRRVLVTLVARTTRKDTKTAKDYRRRTYDFEVSVRNNE